MNWGTHCHVATSPALSRNAILRVNGTWPIFWSRYHGRLVVTSGLPYHNADECRNRYVRVVKEADLKSVGHCPRRWRGVECDNRAGHIIRLDLHPVFSHADHDDFTWTPMDGVISSSLLDLRHLSHLDLSRNQFTKIPGFVGSLKELDCQFPVVDPSSLSHINSSKSLAVLQLIDSIVHPSTFPLLLNISNKLTALHLSKNHLNVTEWLCKDSLQVLDLSVNQIKGSLPEIITRFSSLKELYHDDNKLDGALPDNLSKLKFLTLSFNSLSLNFSSGWIPPFQLNTINLRCNNQLSGNLPDCWMNFKKLVVLNLESNIIESFSQPFIKHNSNLFTKFDCNDQDSNTSWDSNDGTSDQSAATYTDYASVVWKRVEQEYGKTLGLLKVIDLLSNNLSGEIPGELTSLVELITLNLSRNLLSGIIPKEVGQLRALESLDLSTNRLSGEIPLSLADCSFLSCLNLSNNNLSGKIPLSTQLQSFLVESYMGNVGLCGLPLNAICPEDEKQQDGGVEHSNLDDEKWYKGSGFYVSLIIGFTLGFRGLCWTLLFNWPGKPASFRFFDNMVDWLSLTMALIAAKVKRRLNS
ncbi:LRR receptor-like serine/threonine-protein kinase FLS2 isoform X1 [Gossypium australe]|uniref:LRR receptor-like serine/threonine-protein kinase FLS2 isoform X1 n=1 Tax=Gossypium australe TaxID=47621 RepID=A0A5B6W0I5_9ROSI|nr:LRR receptor-like serine/threonine-protein kinase FLS2 isoform X1 [Gossypium australe]